MPLLLRPLVAIALLLSTATARAQVPEGVWVSVLDPYGLVLPHVEVLQIAAGGRAETHIYTRRDVAGDSAKCDNHGLAAAGPCAPGRRHLKGTIRFKGATGDFAFDVTETSQDALEGYGSSADERAPARALLWLGFGASWQADLSGTTLKLVRRTRPVLPQFGLDGSKDVTVERVFLRADVALATELLGLAEAGEMSLAKLACILPHVTDGSPAAVSFREVMADATHLARARDASVAEALAANLPEKAELALQMGAFMRGADSGVDVAKVSAATAIPVARIERVRREVLARPRATAVDEILFPGLAPHHDTIRRCHARWFE